MPPDHAGGRTARDTPRARVFIDARGTERVNFARLGPLGVVLAVLTTGILAVVALVLMFATFLIWVPLVVFFIAGAVIAGLMRTCFRRAR